MLYIREAARNGVSRAALAKEFYVKISTIYECVRGKTYSHLPGAFKDQGNQPKLTHAGVAEVRRRLAAGETGCSIARDLGVTTVIISNIKRNKTHKESALRCSFRLFAP